MSISDVVLGEMLATRLCHDLTGPIGAVRNGTEFIDLEDEDLVVDKEILELIKSSAEESISRLTFYRQAYGRINDDSAANLGAKRQSTKEFLAGGKVELIWADEFAEMFEGEISQNEARLLLNMIIIGNASLLKGGTLEVEIFAGDAGGVELRVTSDGGRVKLEEHIDSIINKNSPVTSLTPHIVQPYLTLRIAQEEKMKLSLSLGESELSIVALK